MKKIIFIFLLFCNSSYAQISESSNEGNVKYDKIFKNPDVILSQNDTDDIITQYNNITIILDTLAFKTDKLNNDFYINLKIKYFSLSEENPDFDKPKKEYGILFKQTIKTDNNVGYLTNLRLTPTTSLENINIIRVEISISKVNSGNDKLNSIISTTLNKLISDTIGLGLVDELLIKQKESSDEILLFKQDFEIPLNSVEYSALSEEKAKNLLKSKESIFVPLNGNSKDDILKGSVIGGVIKFISNTANKVLGTPEITKTYNYDGVAKIHFTNRHNSIIPLELKNDIDDIVQTMLSKDFTSTKEQLSRLQKTNYAYIALPNTNNLLTFTISQFCNLAREHIAYLSGEELSEKSQKNFLNSYKRFFKIMLTHAKNNKFKIYGVSGIIKNGEVPIYVPYTLDESALREFVRWQIDIHELYAQISNK